MTNKILILLLILLSVVFYIQNKEYRKVQIKNIELTKDIKTVRSVAVELKSLEMMMSDDTSTCMEEDSLMDVPVYGVIIVDSETYKDPYEQTLDSILAVTSKYITKN